MDGLGIGPGLTRLNPWYPGQLGIQGSDAPLGMRLLPESVVYYLAPDSPTASDDNDGTDPMHPLATLEEAYDRCRAGQHDTVIYVSGTAGITLDAKLTWAKSYTHLIGVCAPVQTAQRARIFAASDMDDAELIEVPGTGCIFKNLYIFNGAAEATALGCVKVSGGRCYFENVHFAGPGHASNAIDGAYALGLYGGDGEHLFKGCTFGLTTVGAATGVRCVAFLGGYTPRVVFDDCVFAIHATNAGAMIVEDDSGGGSIIEYALWKNCLFFNESETAIDTAFEIDVVDTTRQHFLLLNCWRNSGIDDWEDQAKGCVWCGGMPDMGTGTSQGNMVVATVA